MFCLRFLILFALCSSMLTKNIIVPKEPPEPWKAALMARYIIHNTGWVSFATISTQNKIKDYPFVTLKSLSDGTKRNSTGVPYLYMTEMDVSGKDVESNKKVTIMATLAETSYCETEDFDPQDPRCAKVLITGKLIRIKESSPEYAFGKQVLFDKHPSMKNWPVEHHFYVAKVDLEQIEVLDFFGGLKNVSIENYFNPKITSIINLDVIFNNVTVVVIDNF